MATYISILRGINVGGHNPVKMDALRLLYAELGYSAVQSYIQSGNIIFNSSLSDILYIENSIREKIFETFGFNVSVLVLTTEELNSSLQNNPFIKDKMKNPAFMHMTFLSGLPDKELVDKIPAGFYLPDEFLISGKTVFLYCPAGYGNTKLTNNFFENKLKLTATTRNLNTSNELLNLAEKNKNVN